MTAKKRTTTKKKSKKSSSSTRGKNSKSQTKKTSSSSESTSQRKIRYAVIGLGHIAQVAVLPAFKHAEDNSELVALVSGDREKLESLGKKYKVEHLVEYHKLGDFLRSGAVDAVYIALPNHLHRECVEQAAEAGLHILCEKPMAMTSRECREMIDITQACDVKMMIAYRLHFQKANMQAVKTASDGKLGELKFFNSIFSMQITDPDNIRLDAEGGGPLYDIGTYCVNAARYLFQSDPTRVMAFAARDPEDNRFEEVDEMLSVIMGFPGNRLAQFTCSFGAAATAAFDLVGTKGSLRLESAYEYTEPMKMSLTIDEKTTNESYSKSDQFAPELAYFSECILQNKEPEPNGLEGLSDVRVLEAIEASLDTGRPIYLKKLPEKERPDEGQVIEFPPISRAKTVNVQSPHA